LIAVQEVLRALPSLQTFCSVSQLRTLVDKLRSDSRFDVAVAGLSKNGVPIHHVKCGKGSVRALFVAGPHAMEPIGGLTTFSLLTLLHHNAVGLLDADVEWHIVPCIDPDGSILNEGWTQKPFTFENYIRNFWVQPFDEQVDATFPIRHKELIFDRPAKEALILKQILDQIRPQFYHSLHNGFGGSGTFYLLARNISPAYRRQLQDLLECNRIALNRSSGQSIFCEEFDSGIYEVNTARKYYDYLEGQTTLSPVAEMQGLGANSIEYLSEISPNAQTLVTELTYIRHPDDGSLKKIGQSLRQLKLRIDADNKFLVAAIFEEWERVHGDLDSSSPFYRKIVKEVVDQKHKLHEKSMWSMEPTQDLMFNAAFSKEATENDRIFAYLWRRLMPLCNGYTFVRLLRCSVQTEAVKAATDRLEKIFDEALAEMRRQIDFDGFEVIDCDTLTRVQLGSGLVVLNSVLEEFSSRESNPRLTSVGASLR
jgi:hypothetical protein